MVHFRLTHKIANDLKVTFKSSPKFRKHPLDDWVCDVFRVNRRKVALTMHTKTLISFLFPYREVGGVKNIFDFLPVEIESYLEDLGLEDWVPSTLEIFNQPPLFTKTEDNKILGYMNTFKQYILSCLWSHEKEINWRKLSMSLNEKPTKGIYFKTSSEFLIDFLKKKESHLIIK